LPLQWYNKKMKKRPRIALIAIFYLLLNFNVCMFLCFAKDQSDSQEHKSNNSSIYKYLEQDNSSNVNLGVKRKTKEEGSGITLPLISTLSNST